MRPRRLSNPRLSSVEPVAGPAPAPLESLLVASVAGALTPVITVRMLPFAMAVGQESTVPSFNAMHLAPSVRKSRGTASRLAVLQPIDTLALTAPANVRRPLESSLPRPGLVPVEFHTHSLRSGPLGRPEWKTARPTLVPPKFKLRPVPEKLEDPNAQQKTVRKEPEVVKILNMPAAKRPPTVLMVFGRVAAGFLLVASLWFGITNASAAIANSPPYAKSPPVRLPFPRRIPASREGGQRTRQSSRRPKEPPHGSGRPSPTAPRSKWGRTSTVWRIGTSMGKRRPRVGRAIRMAT